MNPLEEAAFIAALAAKWIQWARTALFVARGLSSPEVGEYALLDALVDANDDPLEQECIVYALRSNLARRGYRRPGPPLPTDARRAKRFVDAVCSQLAQRQLWGARSREDREVRSSL